MALLILIFVVIAAIAALAILKPRKDDDPSGSIAYPYQAAGPPFFCR